MTGTFTHWAGKPQYYRLPVEVWRGLLDNPGEVLRLCKALMCADCDNLQTLSEVYGWRFLGMTKQNNASFRDMKMRGQAFLGTLGSVRVCFTISKEMFWQYNDSCKNGTLKEWDWLLLLWWMSLHTIDGKRKGANAIKDTTNIQVFRRAAGFSTTADYEAYRWNGDEAILKYIANPARYAVRLRNDLMAKYDTFHAYSEQGRRGWCFILAKVDRQQAINCMAEHMAKRGTRKQFKQTIADMYAKARATRDGAAENQGGAPQREPGTIPPLDSG